MNTAITQALLRAVRVFVVAGLVALGADLTGIVNIGIEGSGFELYAPFVLSILVAIVEAALKAIGGPTQQVPASHGRGAPLGAGESPNILSV